MIVKQILLGVQELLDTPNLESPAQGEALHLMQRNPSAYKQKILAYAKECSSPIMGKNLPLTNQKN